MAYTWRSLLLLFSLIGCARAQQCAQGTAILKLSGMDPACQAASSAIPECASKMQLTTTQLCTVQLQPDLAVATDGTFCDPSKGMQQRDMIGGKFSLGRSDIDFLMRPHAPTGVILMNMKGRIVPAGGGREYPLDCNLMYNVTAGSALGIMSSGTDSLMSTSVNPSAQAGGALAGGGYSGAGMLPGQQNGQLFMGSSDTKKEAAPAAKSSASAVGGSASAKLIAAAAAVLAMMLPALV